MAVQTVPTKGNLMNTKKSLALAKNGYELLDRKRNILIIGYLSFLLFSLLYFSLSIFNNSSNSLTACSIEK